MKCPYCKEKISEDAKVCPICGENIPALMSYKNTTGKFVVKHKKKLIITLSIAVMLILIKILVLPNLHTGQVLSNYPVLKPTIWDWSVHNYIEENNSKNKQRISDKFIKVMDDEEKALDDYIVKNNISRNKRNAFLKHTNNVEAVSKDLAQVVDWIIYEELSYPEKSTSITKSLYGIKYRFQSTLIYDEGEKFYTYSRIELIDYPMIEMKLDYVGTELHVVATVNKDYYIQKYSKILDEETLATYKTTKDLSTLNYEEINILGLPKLLYKP